MGICSFDTFFNDEIDNLSIDDFDNFNNIFKLDNDIDVIDHFFSSNYNNYFFNDTILCKCYRIISIFATYLRYSIMDLDLFLISIINMSSI